MNYEQTIERARTHIAMVLTASDSTDLARLAGCANTWLNCLHIEGLVDREVFEQLSLELKNVTDDVSARLANEAPEQRKWASLADRFLDEQGRPKSIG